MSRKFRLRARPAADFTPPCRQDIVFDGEPFHAIMRVSPPVFGLTIESLVEINNGVVTVAAGV